jgi:hypothetical protein
MRVRRLYTKEQRAFRIQTGQGPKDTYLNAVEAIKWARSQKNPSPKQRKLNKSYVRYMVMQHRMFGSKRYRKRK